MLYFEINIANIKSIYKTQIKKDDNFLIDYARRINYFGCIILSNCSSDKLLKKICSVAECYLMMNSPKPEKIKSVLQMGVKKIIISEKDVDKIDQKLSKNVIMASITLPKVKSINLITFKQDLQEIFNRLNHNCSGFLIDFNEEFDIDQNIVLETIKMISSFTQNSLILHIPESKFSSVIERKGVNPLIRSLEMFEEKDMINVFKSIIIFQKGDGLVPTIVRDEYNQILMLAYSSKESLEMALIQKEGIYYSRSRNSIWNKGKTSGNYQSLIQARYDCDQDTLLFTVRQFGVACHLQRYSCFGDKEFKLLDLYEIIQDRILNPIDCSYTSKISKDEQLIIEKIKEESNEVINYTDEENLIWEIADLLYFLMVLMAKKEINLQDILNELWSRRNYGN